MHESSIILEKLKTDTYQEAELRKMLAEIFDLEIENQFSFRLESDAKTEILTLALQKVVAWAKKDYAKPKKWRAFVVNTLETKSIILLICSNKTRLRQEAMQRIATKYQGEILDFWSKKMTTEAAQDLTGQAVVSLFENIIDGKYKGDSSIRTYLWSIVNNLNKKRLQKEKQLFTSPLEEADWQLEYEILENPETFHLKKEQQDVVAQILSGLGDNCQKVLYRWSLNYSMKEIAEELKYKNETVVRNIKRRCFKKLLHLLSENPNIQKIIEEIM